MKGSKGSIITLVPVMITLSLYLVFFQRIESKPDSAGFWIIIALGMSVGVSLVRFLKRDEIKNSDEK